MEDETLSPSCFGWPAWFKAGDMSRHASNEMVIMPSPSLLIWRPGQILQHGSSCPYSPFRYEVDVPPSIAECSVFRASSLRVYLAVFGEIPFRLELEWVVEYYRVVHDSPNQGRRASEADIIRLIKHYGPSVWYYSRVCWNVVAFVDIIGVRDMRKSCICEPSCTFNWARIHVPKGRTECHRPTSLTIAAI